MVCASEFLITLGSCEKFSRSIISQRRTYELFIHFSCDGYYPANIWLLLNGPSIISGITLELAAGEVSSFSHSNIYFGLGAFICGLCRKGIRFKEHVYALADVLSISGMRRTCILPDGQLLTGQFPSRCPYLSP